MERNGGAPIGVLLVDDHPLFLRGVRDLIETSDDIVIVGETTSPDEALRMAKETFPNVVVIDVTLEKASGVSLMRKVLAEFRPPRCLLLSAHEELDVITEALAAGALGYLFKRSTGDHLLDAIRAANQNSLYLDPAIKNRFGIGNEVRSSHRALNPKKDLTEREREVVKYVAFGYSNKEIAARINVTVKSIETYKMRACNKLDIHTRSKIVQYAMRQGWFENSQS